VLALAGPGVEVIADALSVEPHIEAASVVLAPMRTGGGMRMKVLEAVARGKPVVTTPLGAEGLIEFDEAPPVLIGNSTDEIAALTADLLADPGRRRELGLSARSFTERHCTPQAWANRLTQVYEEAIAAARG
jgi:glycosyltransferase involved in cell wall biosynthesis